MERDLQTIARIARDRGVSPDMVVEAIKARGVHPSLILGDCGPDRYYFDRSARVRIDEELATMGAERRSKQPKPRKERTR